LGSGDVNVIGLGSITFLVIRKCSFSALAKRWFVLLSSAGENEQIQQVLNEKRENANSAYP